MARIILTRPSGQSLAWEEALRSAGHEVVSQPLIEIVMLDAPKDGVRREAATQQLPNFAAAMFVSKAAVDGFFKRSCDTGLTKPAGHPGVVTTESTPNLRFWATGPGTVAALREHNCPAAKIYFPGDEAAQFDSEALWRIVQPQVRSGTQVLIVRGRDEGEKQSSRDWLTHQIQAAGGRTHVLEVYERRAPNWTARHLTQCQTWMRDGSIWVLSSSQGVRHLPADLDVSQARCVCTHERIAQTARMRGFSVVCASRPSIPDLLASIKSMDD